MPFCYEQTSPLARRNMRCIIHSKLKFTAHSLRCFSSSQKPLVFGSPVFLYAFGFSLSVLHAFFLARQALCRRFADSPCAAGAEARCTYFVQIPHTVAHGTVTSRGAEHRSRKTKPLHLRQRTSEASFAPARSFRHKRADRCAPNAC